MESLYLENDTRWSQCYYGKLIKNRESSIELSHFRLSSVTVEGHFDEPLQILTMCQYIQNRLRQVWYRQMWQVHCMLTYIVDTIQ